jgi:hypothetical protein
MPRPETCASLRHLRPRSHVSGQLLPVLEQAASHISEQLLPVLEQAARHEDLLLDSRLDGQTPLTCRIRDSVGRRVDLEAVERIRVLIPQPK